MPINVEEFKEKREMTRQGLSSMLESIEQNASSLKQRLDDDQPVVNMMGVFSQLSEEVNNFTLNIAAYAVFEEVLKDLDDTEDNGG